MQTMWKLLGLLLVTLSWIGCGGEIDSQAPEQQQSQSTEPSKSSSPDPAPQKSNCGADYCPACLRACHYQAPCIYYCDCDSPCK